MDRRRFLKMFAASAVVASVTALGVRGYTELEKVAAHEKPDTAAGVNVMVGLIDFLETKAPIKMIGVDHDVTEPDLYERLAGLSNVLVENNIKKVFVEVSTSFAPLFKQADKMSRFHFAASYMNAYPDQKSWELDARKQKVFEAKASLHDMIVALKEKGIEVVPYDQRHKNDLSARTNTVENLDAAMTQIDQEVGKRNTIVEKAITLGAFLASGAESLGRRKLELSEKALRQMRVQNNEALLAGEAAMQAQLRCDPVHKESILAALPLSHGALVVAGNFHIESPTGLRSQMEASGAQVGSMTYLNEQAPGEMKAYANCDVGAPRILADRLLSYNTGEVLHINGPLSRGGRSLVNVRNTPLVPA